MVREDDRATYLGELGFPAGLVLRDPILKRDVAAKQVGAGDFQPRINIHLALRAVVVLEQRRMAVVKREKVGGHPLVARKPGGLMRKPKPHPRPGQSCALRQSSGRSIRCRQGPPARRPRRRRPGAAAAPTETTERPRPSAGAAGPQPIRRNSTPLPCRQPPRTGGCCTSPGNSGSRTQQTAAAETGSAPGSPRRWFGSRRYLRSGCLALFCSRSSSLLLHRRRTFPRPDRRCSLRRVGASG